MVSRCATSFKIARKFPWFRLWSLSSWPFCAISCMAVKRSTAQTVLMLARFSATSLWCPLSVKLWTDWPCWASTYTWAIVPLHPCMKDLHCGLSTSHISLLSASSFETRRQRRPSLSHVWLRAKNVCSNSSTPHLPQLSIPAKETACTN